MVSTRRDGPSRPGSPRGAEHDAHPTPAHSSLEIELAAENFYFKGIGSSAEPCLVSGEVILSLNEPTSIKVVTLHLKGKSRIPAVGAIDTGNLHHTTYQTTLVYSHDWSFLAGDNLRAHTLNPGRHVFPFQVEIEPNAPCSMHTRNTGLGISYKFRATAVRATTFSTNLHAQCPVTLLRSLSHDALEYQQTLEIENTWPEKLMYSIMLPHKAWAAGDTVSALVKFSPLTKGIGVQGVVTTIKEVTKVHYKYGPVEHTRSVASIKHEFWEGRPRVVDTFVIHPSSRSQGGMFHVPQQSAESATSIPGSFTYPNTPTQHQSRTSTPVHEAPPRYLSRRPSRPDASQPSTSRAPARPRPVDNEPPSPVRDDSQGEQDLVAVIPLTLPPTATPSHTSEPIEVNYRIRWSVSILNSDGHVSELRCSLPIFVLDHHLLTEARIASNETRRICFGLEEDSTRPAEQIELPSYNNHILDRVANSYFPADALRVPNPWVTRGMGDALLPTSPEGDSSELDYVNSELMVSLGQSFRSEHGHAQSTGSPPHSHSDSEPSSRRASRSQSRASSPERERSQLHPFPTLDQRSPGPSSPSPRHTSRFLKSFTSLSMSSSRNHSRTNTSTSHPLHASSPPSPTTGTAPSSLGIYPSPNSQAQASSSSTRPANNHSDPAHPVPLSAASPSQEARSLLMSAFTEVPGYDVASRGFLGGGIPPLELLRGLPSYEEAERRNRTTSTPSGALRPGMNRTPSPLRDETPASSASFPIVGEPHNSESS